MTMTAAGHVRSLIDRSITGAQQLSVDALSVCTILATNIRFDSISYRLLSSSMAGSLLPVDMFVFHYSSISNPYSTAGALINSAARCYLTGGPGTAAGFVSLLLRSDI
jgi:hypothetical protein